MLYHHSYYGVSPLPLPNVISFTTTISTTSASLYHSCILDHCFFGLPLFVWTTTTLWIATIFLDYRCIYVSNKAVCDPNFRFFEPYSFCCRVLRVSAETWAVVCMWVGEWVRDVSVTAWVCTDHEILCLPCLFHVLAVKLDIWNFVYAFLASIPTCMHGFIMFRIQ